MKKIKSSQRTACASMAGKFAQAPAFGNRDEARPHRVDKSRERIKRELRAEIAQLPVGDSTSLVVPLHEDPLQWRCAEAEHNARECEKKVRKNENDMRSGAWRPVDIEETLLSSRKPPKEVVAPPPAMEALGFDQICIV